MRSVAHVRSADPRTRRGDPRLTVSCVWSALGWGAVAAGSLAVGAVLGVTRQWRGGLIGAVLAFGAGALISSVAFELAQEGLRIGSPVSVAVGLAVGAICFFAANKLVARIGGRGGGSSAGLPLAIGALLDGIPEQAVLGIGLATGGAISIALLVAIFVSNLPEAIGSSTDMADAGKPKSVVLGLWAAVATVCALATLGGFALADVAGDELKAGIDGFAAGALLVMLVDSMIPEASDKAGDRAGLATVLGFAVAAGLSQLSDEPGPTRTDQPDRTSPARISPDRAGWPSRARRVRWPGRTPTFAVQQPTSARSLSPTTMSWNDAARSATP